MAQTGFTTADIGPNFLRERWAACTNIDCERFGKWYRHKQPVTKALCRGCDRTDAIRTPQWSGWIAAKAEHARS